MNNLHTKSFVETFSLRPDHFAKEIEIDNDVIRNLSLYRSYVENLEISSHDIFMEVVKDLATLSSPDMDELATKNNALEALDHLVDFINEKLERYNDPDGYESLENLPCENLQYLLSLKGMQEEELDEILNISYAHRKKIINGTRSISKESASLLGVKFNVDPNIFIKKI